MKSFEIYWYDLSDKKQREMIEQGFEVHENINLCPITILEQVQKVEEV